jgi:hypothetical protein
MMMKDNAGQMPGPGVTVIIVIPLRLRVSVDNRWITVVRSVRSNSQIVMDGRLRNCFYVCIMYIYIDIYISIISVGASIE